MAIRDDFAPGEVLAAADLNDTFASKVALETTVTQALVNTGATNVTPLSVRGVSGQTANIFDVRNSASAELFAVDSLGLLTGGFGQSLGPWTSYTPSVSAQTGTFTTVSATGRHCKIGRICMVQVTISVTTNGTADTAVDWTVPFTSGSGIYVGVGRGNAISGNQLQTRLANGTTTARLWKYDGNYPASSGESLVISLIYETAS